MVNNSWLVGRDTVKQLRDRAAKGDRCGATAADIADGDRAVLCACALVACYNSMAVERGQRIDAIMRGEDPAQRFACGEMLEEDL